MGGEQILEIAYPPDGKLYGIVSSKIIEINLSEETYDEVYQFLITGQYSSLFYNSNNQILTLELNTNHLIIIDIATFTEVSDVVLNESLLDDLTYYKGNLIFQGSLSNNIQAYQQGSIKTVACGCLY